MAIVFLENELLFTLLILSQKKKKKKKKVDWVSAEILKSKGGKLYTYPTNTLLNHH